MYNKKLVSKKRNSMINDISKVRSMSFMVLTKNTFRESIERPLDLDEKSNLVKMNYSHDDNGIESLSDLIPNLTDEETASQ